MHFSRLSPLQRYLSFHKSSRRRTSTARPPSRLTLSLLTLLQPVRALLPRVPTFQGGNGNSHPSALPFGSHPRSNVCTSKYNLFLFFSESPFKSLIPFQSMPNSFHLNLTPWARLFFSFWRKRNWVPVPLCGRVREKVCICLSSLSFLFCRGREDERWRFSKPKPNGAN